MDERIYQTLMITRHVLAALIIAIGVASLGQVVGLYRMAAPAPMTLCVFSVAFLVTRVMIDRHIRRHQ